MKRIKLVACDKKVAKQKKNHKALRSAYDLSTSKELREQLKAIDRAKVGIWFRARTVRIG